MSERIVVSVARHGRVALPVQVCFAQVEAAVCARCGRLLDPRASAVAPAVGDPAWELVCPRCLSDADKATLDAVEASVGFAAFVSDWQPPVDLHVPDLDPRGEAS